MCECSFYFHSSPQIELTEVRCDSLRGLRDPIWCVRGKTTGPFEATGTFQWTRAVQALSILMVRYVLFSSGGDLGNSGHLLSGERRTLASSLDRAIRRDSPWLIDMFGSNSRGIPLARYLFVRANSGLKRPGPVTVAVNQKVLPLYAVKLFLDGREIKKLSELKKLLQEIEAKISTAEQAKMVVNS